MHSWGTFPILYVCQHSAVLPYISLISLSIGWYLELAIFREDFSSAASVTVRFSWVFYFVFICSGYLLNSPHYIMGGIPRPVFIRGFPDFLKSRFSSRILVCWIQWGRERRIILKRFVTVVAWKFLKISCFFSFCRSVVGTSGLAPSPTSGPLILPVFGKIWEIVFTYFANFETSRRFSRLN